MENLEVKILDQREVIHHPRPNQPVIMVAVTYQVGNGIPGVVFIEKGEYSETRLRNDIREDLKNRHQDGPRIVKL